MKPNDMTEFVQDHKGVLFTFFDRYPRITINDKTNPYWTERREEWTTLNSEGFNGYIVASYDLNGDWLLKIEYEDDDAEKPCGFHWQFKKLSELEIEYWDEEKRAAWQEAWEEKRRKKYED